MSLFPACKIGPWRTRRRTARHHMHDLALGDRANKMCADMGRNGAAPLRRKASGWMVTAAGLAQPCGHGFYYRAVGVVIFESPDEGATQAARHTSTHITRLQPHGDGIVV
jgi:hypothetical protein